MRIRRYTLSVEDLAKTRLIGTLGPLAETAFALQTLQHTASPALFEAWRRTARRRIPPQAAAITRFIAPANSVILDVPSLVGVHAEMDDALDRLRGVPQWMLYAEVDYVVGSRRVPDPVGQLAFGDGPARTALARTLKMGFSATVEPYWDRVKGHLEARTLVASRVLAARGIAGLLSSHPSLTWNPPVLELRRRTISHDPWNATLTDFHLEGRGLDIALSLFSTWPSMLHPEDTQRPFILVLPARPTLQAGADIWSKGEHADHRRLASLLGRTRAAVLESIAEGRTTGEIARHLNISSAGASQHATVLREAGLITTQRHRNTVIHTLTTLGAMLLNGG
ncbi:ArsR/SmtB family transcription factor [Nonomuraea endophytica]|uniref:DNA-binding transcriptional ArsR family regulator n=1 Tax=Nonomuraea endophytica TaxID=714136 RepID=A0A7W8AEB7_9ACTN|nr:winged helix-turn-helix domain-containing protein [Nonomuraea endophytica]MBB5084722.1 DNA-binding transcriptional ArsR family regulator [Nonomuraea endophytica]